MDPHRLCEITLFRRKPDARSSDPEVDLADGVDERLASNRYSFADAPVPACCWSPSPADQSLITNKNCLGIRSA